MSQTQLDFESEKQKPRSNAGTQNALVRDYLMARLGQWVDAWTLFELDRIRALNSRISNVRDEIAAQGLDVDSRCTDSSKQHWEYRICTVAQSERIQRRNSSGE